MGWPAFFSSEFRFCFNDNKMWLGSGSERFRSYLQIRICRIPEAANRREASSDGGLRQWDHTSVLVGGNMITLQEVAQECTCRRVRMAARSITRTFDEALRPVDLKVTQFTLLVAVSQQIAGSISDLADWLAMERTTLTRNLQLLEKRGLVEVGAEGYRRARQIRLTQQGKDLVIAAIPFWRKAQDAVRRRIGTEKWRQTHDRLDELVKAS